MKPTHNPSTPLILICLLGASLLTGCAFSTARVNLNYVPAAQSKSPLSTVKPLTIAILVEDQRDSAERDRIGDKKNGYGMRTAKVLSKQEVTAVLYDALKAELENNGHKVTPAGSGAANLTVTVALDKMWSDAKIHFLDVEMIGTINSDVAITHPPDASPNFSKPITGSYHESRQMAADGAFEKALNGALTEFVHNFAYDPGVLEIMNKAPSQ